MLMRDTPVAIDFPQSDGETKEKSSLDRRTTGCSRATTHDRDGEGNVVSGGNCKFFDVERL